MGVYFVKLQSLRLFLYNSSLPWREKGAILSGVEAAPRGARLAPRSHTSSRPRSGGLVSYLTVPRLHFPSALPTATLGASERSAGPSRPAQPEQRPLRLSTKFRARREGGRSLPRRRRARSRPRQCGAEGRAAQLPAAPVGPRPGPRGAVVGRALVAGRRCAAHRIQRDLVRHVSTSPPRSPRRLGDSFPALVPQPQPCPRRLRAPPGPAAVATRWRH